MRLIEVKVKGSLSEMGALEIEIVILA